jgi:hypothetical protein
MSPSELRPAIPRELVAVSRENCARLATRLEEITRANPETRLFFPTDDSEDARERATDMNLFTSTLIEATRALPEGRDADAGAYLASSGRYLNRGYPLAERDE